MKEKDDGIEIEIIVGDPKKKYEKAVINGELYKRVEPEKKEIKILGYSGEGDPRLDARFYEDMFLYTFYSSEPIPGSVLNACILEELVNGRMALKEKVLEEVKRYRDQVSQPYCSAADAISRRLKKLFGGGAI